MTRKLKYRLTPEAEEDLREIGRYTAATWGETQAHRYKSALVRGFEAMAAGSSVMKLPLPHRLDLRCCRCGHHFIFSLHREGELPAVIAILHENMDLPTRLRERLEAEEKDG